MKTSVLSQNEITVPSLFQIAAFFEDFFPADNFGQPTAKLRQTPFADWLLHPEKLAALLKSTPLGNDATTMPTAKVQSSERRAANTTKKRVNRLGKMVSRPLELKKVGFYLEAPEASSVRLAADFTDWEQRPVEMMHSPDGVWFTVVPLAPGPYSYRFIMDGQWCDDPRSRQRVPNPFGTENAMIQVA